MKERIIKNLTDNLNPKFLEVKNNSYLHKGHAGDNGTSETHFEVIIAADEFNGMLKVQAHRRINQLLKMEFENGMHALEIKIK